MHHRVSSLTPCVLFVWLLVGANCQLNFNVKVSCPIFNDDREYVYFKKVEQCLFIVGWDKSVDLCSYHNGYSACISNDIVHQLILDNETFKRWRSLINYDEYFIGLNYDSQKKSWVWLDNTPLTIDKWATGEQNSSKPCVVWKNGYWHRRDCITSTRFGFCEGTPIYETAGVCDERFGWSMFKKGRKCLKKFSDKKTWSQAQQVCTAEGGNLLNIPDDTTVAFLTGPWDSGDRWVELTKKGSSSTWTWNRTPNNLVAHYSSEYWRLLKNKLQECSVIIGGKSPKWKKFVKCTRRKKFICEVKCDAGWILFQPEKTCIKVVSGLSEMTTYSGAVESCERLGGDLITPGSIEMSIFIKAITSLHRRYWINVAKISNEFRKVERCNVSHQLKFTNWDAFQPDLTSGDHVWIWNDKWSVASNDTIPANYICERTLV